MLASGKAAAAIQPDSVVGAGVLLRNPATCGTNQST